MIYFKNSVPKVERQDVLLFLRLLFLLEESQSSTEVTQNFETSGLKMQRFF